jgi:hybrid cluster-associated redox disulfide protein
MMPTTTAPKSPATITGDMLISDIVVNFPEVVDYLVNECGFHCVTCFISAFETFEEGARVHGIAGADFQDLLKNVNELINQEVPATSTTEIGLDQAE